MVFAYLGEALPAEDRTQGIGWLTSATSLAAMIGPAIGSFATLLGDAAPGLIIAAVSLLTFVLAWFTLPEPSSRRDVDAGSESEPERESLWRTFGDVAAHPTRPTSGLIWLYFFGTFTFTAVTSVIALDLVRRFDVDETRIWWFFTYIAGISVVMRVFVLGPLVRRQGERRLLCVGAVVLGLATALLPWPSNVPLFAGRGVLRAGGDGDALSLHHRDADRDAARSVRARSAHGSAAGVRWSQSRVRADRRRLPVPAGGSRGSVRSDRRGDGAGRAVGDATRAARSCRRSGVDLNTVAGRGRPEIKRDSRWESLNDLW